MTIVGRVVSHYTVLEKLGEGGMGVVYKARDTRLDRFAALKVLPADKVADAERTRRFVQEAKAASALNHPNVITIYDIDVDQGVDFIAMEFVAGRSFDRVIPRQGLRANEVLRYGVQIADALSAAHAAGIIHRDLKPANLMVTESGLVKVLDFGIAKLSEKVSPDSDQLTASVAAPETDEGKILGTIVYMSPEQAQGLKIDARSDIFSFGAVLYEMLTGHRAFSGETKVSTLAAILDREPQALAETTPRELDRIVTRCLKKDPARRFQTMADLKVALEELKEESDSGRLSAPAGAVARKRGVPLVAMAAAVVVIVGAAAAWWQRGSPAPAGVQNRHLVQLTFDAGESSFPSLSPDAKLVAFQSDRAGPGRFDIWVQQTAGGSPLRLTTGTGSYRHPVFSHDGSKIYFESTGTPQGIYEISALGGDPRLVVASARGPTLSLDGRLMAYFSLPSLQILIRPSAGGEAHAIGPGLSILGGLTPIWFDDAQYVAAFAQKTGQPETREWWAIPVENGEAMRLSWARWATEHHHIGIPGAVLPRQSALASLATRANENRQIYLVKTEGLLRTPIGEPEPFTSGAAWSENASVAAGKVAFQSGIPETAVWSLPANTTDGRVTGDLERVTMARAVHANVSATPDGKTIVFSSNQTGSMDVLIRDMASGQEHALTSDAPQLSKQYALVDTAGTEVVYSMPSPESRGGVYVVSARGGASRKICDGCSPTLSLAPGGKQFLAYQADAMHSHINIVDVASGHATPLLQDPQYAVTTARFSPDGRWVAFLLTRGVALADVVVAPMRGTEAIPGPDWITVTPAPADVQQVFWSPDGGLVYYVVTTAGGASSIVARHLDAGRHPVGPPIRVYDFTGRVRPPISAVGTSSPVPDTLSAVPGRFIGVLSELNYNIWMMDLPK